MSDARPDDDFGGEPLAEEFVDPSEVEAMEEAAAEQYAAAAGSVDADDHLGEAEVLSDPLTAELDAELDAAAAQVENDLDLATIASVTRERDDYLDALRRLQADFENYKKRMARQQSEALERAGEAVVEKLLPVLDAIDLARQHGAGGGVDQVATALFDALGKEGLERIDTVGAPFDPNEHEAVAHAPAEDGDDGQVIAVVMRTGYRWKGRLLRPAMVSVRG